MKNAGRFVIVVALAALSVAAVGMSSPNRTAAGEPLLVSVQGACSRTVKGDRTSVKLSVDEDNMKKVIASGLTIVRRGIDKALDLMENAPQTEVKSNVAVSYESTTSKGEKSGGDVEMDQTFHVPEVTSDNFDPSFVDDIIDDMPSFDEVVKSDTKYSVSKERLEKEYKECADEAMKDARAKAEAIAAAQGAKVVSSVSVSQSESRVVEDSVEEASAVKISVKLDVTFRAE
ncbi:MAG: SIMPL domain-containing protein [Rickettsiales bacterium]|jgi:hypothetical protein|nr:SIMPL domain-containing protein [Rickettsiales bacterium]